MKEKEELVEIRQEFPVEISERAIAQVKKLQAKGDKADHFLRLGVKGGGCSGLEYVVKLDTRRTDFDISTEVDGLEVVVDSKSALYLKGSTLDYTGELLGTGFQFDNPNAKRGCGCGTSFTPKTLA